MNTIGKSPGLSPAQTGQFNESRIMGLLSEDD